MTTLTLSLGVCTTCGTLPDGSLSLTDEEGKTLDLFRVHSGTKRCSLSSNEHPIYGSLPTGSYLVEKTVQGGGLKVPFPEYLLLTNETTDQKHFAWHNPSPGYGAPGGIIFPRLNDWKRFISLISDEEEPVYVYHHQTIKSR